MNKHQLIVSHFKRTHKHILKEHLHPGVKLSQYCLWTAFLILLCPFTSICPILRWRLQSDVPQHRPQHRAAITTIQEAPSQIAPETSRDSASNCFSSEAAFQDGPQRIAVHVIAPGTARPFQLFGLQDVAVKVCKVSCVRYVIHTDCIGVQYDWEVSEHFSDKPGACSIWCYVVSLSCRDYDLKLKIDGYSSILACCKMMT